MILILRVLGCMFSCLAFTSTKMKIRTISASFFMGPAILFQKSYVVSNGKPMLPPAIRRKHWPVCCLHVVYSTVHFCEITEHCGCILTEFKVHVHCILEYLPYTKSQFKTIFGHFYRISESAPNFMTNLGLNIGKKSFCMILEDVFS